MVSGLAAKSAGDSVEIQDLHSEQAAGLVPLR